MKKPVLFGIIFVLIVLGVIVYSSFNLAKVRLEVCINFNGRDQLQNCFGGERGIRDADRGRQRLRGDRLRRDRNRGLRAHPADQSYATEVTAPNRDFSERPQSARCPSGYP